MPIYEYECTVCGRRTERLQRVDEPPLVACPACGGTVKKLFSAPAVQFKGSGWYVTDYAGRGKGKAAEGAGAGKEGKEGKEAAAGGKGEAAAGGGDKGGDQSGDGKKAAGGGEAKGS